MLQSQGWDLTGGVWQTGGSTGRGSCLRGSVSLPSIHLQGQLVMWPFLGRPQSS